MVHEERLPSGEQTVSTVPPTAQGTPTIASPPRAQATAPRAQGVSPRSGKGARFVLWCLASLFFGGLGGYLSDHHDKILAVFGEVTGNTATNAAGESSSSQAEKAASADAVAAYASEVRDLLARIDKLTQETRGLKERFDAQPRPEDCPSVAALQIKVAELAKAASEVAPLAGRVERTDNRLENLNQIVNDLQDSLGTARARAARNITPSSNTSSPSGTASTALSNPAEAGRHETNKPVLAGASHDASRQELDPGVSLFQQGKYKEAFDRFSQLELTRPDDARVWYFAALSRGLSTKSWGNGTEQLVERGIERERAGTPKTAEIDEAFRSLTSDTGKDWLQAYRQRVKEQ